MECGSGSVSALWRGSLVWQWWRVSCGVQRSVAVVACKFWRSSVMWQLWRGNVVWQWLRGSCGEAV